MINTRYIYRSQPKHTADCGLGIPPKHHLFSWGHNFKWFSRYGPMVFDLKCGHWRRSSTWESFVPKYCRFNPASQGPDYYWKYAVFVWPIQIARPHSSSFGAHWDKSQPGRWWNHFLQFLLLCESVHTKRWSIIMEDPRAGIAGARRGALYFTTMVVHTWMEGLGVADNGCFRADSLSESDERQTKFEWTMGWSGTMEMVKWSCRKVRYLD